MNTVKKVLATKSADIYYVTESTSVLDGLKLMTEKNISSLLIIEGPDLKGIFTERDYARKIVLQGKASKDTPISEAMTSEPITVSLNDTIEHCMEIMSDQHIRHLPVVEGTTVQGMISIGDVVKSIIAEQKMTITQLENYINS